MTARVRPDFVIIGAAKAATTWLGNQLRARPDVFLPMQEPHYFSREYARGADWYARWFGEAEPGQMIGEKSADYLHDPRVAERLSRDLPHAKLVVQLRDPVERAYSDYCMFYRRGAAGRDIRHHLDPNAVRPIPRFVADGFYHAHISGFLQHFPAERIKVVLFEDLKADPRGIARDVEAFLGLPELSDDEAVANNANVKNAPTLPLPLRKALAPAKQLVAPLRDRAWFKTLHSSLAREVDYPALPDDTRTALRAAYAPDTAALEILLGRDLSIWTQARASQTPNKSRAA